MSSNDSLSRRRFVAILPGLLIGVAGAARFARALDTAAAPHVHRCGSATAARGERPSRRAHPDPRKGIDGSRVLTKAQLTDNPDAAPVFDMVRRIPRIADGIRCHCGCADDPAFRSLLSCYEGDGMAQHCEICQGQGRLAFRLAKRGKSLAQIRAAIDEEFG